MAPGSCSHNQDCPRAGEVVKGGTSPNTEDSSRNRFGLGRLSTGSVKGAPGEQDWKREGGRGVRMALALNSVS